MQHLQSNNKTQPNERHQMSDLAIMFDEAYDAINSYDRLNRIQAIQTRWNLTWEEVVTAYNDYIDSDLFYAQRGM